MFKIDHSPIHRYIFKIVYDVDGKNCHFICSGYADDALVAHHMNVKPGGLQPRMRPGWYMRGGVKIQQSMVFEEGPNEGNAKGLREVCRERFGEDLVKGNLKGLLGEIESKDFK